LGALIDIIENYSPANEQQGVPLLSPITINFDRLMDEESVEHAFFLEGPDTDVVIGPNSSASIPSPIEAVELGQSYDFLTSAGMKGIVPGDFTFTQSANKTSMLFQPDTPLKASTNYAANLYQAYSLSVGDTTADAGNVGNGEFEFTGSWTGGAENINMRITTSGVGGVAEFIWWVDGDVFNLHGPFQSSRREEILLTDNVYAKFLGGTFNIDDAYSASLSVPTLYSGQIYFEFDTGSGSIQALSSTTSTSVLSSLNQLGASSITPITVLTTDPSDEDVQVNRDLNLITVNFSKVLDASTVTDDNVTVTVTSLTDHPLADTQVAGNRNGELSKLLTVSGQTLTIQI
jgi:hypothetical protein